MSPPNIKTWGCSVLLLRRMRQQWTKLYRQNIWVPTLYYVFTEPLSTLKKTELITVDGSIHTTFCLKKIKSTGSGSLFLNLQQVWFCGFFKAGRVTNNFLLWGSLQKMFQPQKKKFWRESPCILNIASYPFCLCNSKGEFRRIIHKTSEGFVWLITLCNDSWISFSLQWWDVWEFQAVLSQTSVFRAQLRIPLVSMRFLTVLEKTCVVKTSYGKWETSTLVRFGQKLNDGEISINLEDQCVSFCGGAKLFSFLITHFTNMKLLKRQSAQSAFTKRTKTHLWE